MGRNIQSIVCNYFNRTFSLKWIKNNDKQLAYVWGKVPWPLNKFIVIFAVFAFGISSSGHWVNIWMHVTKQFNFSARSFESIGLKNFWIYFLSSTIISFFIFFSVGGFLQWYFYVRRKDCPESWKCQPSKFLTPELERNEFLLGSSNLFIQCTASSILTCYISNGGYSTIYYEFAKYGWTWLFLQFPVVFIYQDYLTYWIHRLFHTPWLYKHFHKVHHRYKQPTAWSVTAMHPVEALSIQCGLTSPIFLFPVHWVPLYIIVTYLYYHGMRDHSGINFKSFWWQPWQPDTIFHDNHHQYFHVNFGFNVALWDKLHGTYRQTNRVYNEKIFYGKGKPLKEATITEVKEYLEETKAENPLAYRKNLQKCD